MSYEQKDNTGTLFVNDKKELETHADSKGSALIDGVEYWVNAWRKTPKNGGKQFLSMSFKRKEAPAAPRPAPAPAPARRAEPTPPATLAEDDIPF